MTCAKCGRAAEELILEKRDLVCFPWCGAEDTLADARLVAAAPDLLEACRAALAWISDEDGRVADLVQAAIAKATGQ